MRSYLKQYIDGVSVNDDVMSNANPLFVVNYKVNLNRPPVDRAEVPRAFVEANVVVNNTAMQKLHLT